MACHTSDRPATSLTFVPGGSPPRRLLPPRPPEVNINGARIYAFNDDGPETVEIPPGALTGGGEGHGILRGHPAEKRARLCLPEMDRTRAECVIQTDDRRALRAIPAAGRSEYYNKGNTVATKAKFRNYFKWFFAARLTPARDQAGDGISGKRPR